LTWIGGVFDPKGSTSIVLTRSGVQRSGGVDL
jgi:hypothetical protein